MDNKRLEKLVEQEGLSIKDCGNGHIQIIGALLVNYYPESKQKSAYIAGTRQKYTYVSPEQAVKMAKTPPKPSRFTGKRRKTPPIKQKLFNRIKNCHWCGCNLTLKTATLEHIIPLNRGGLDNENNMTLACYECNHKRGCNMPELEDAKCS